MPYNYLKAHMAPPAFDPKRTEFNCGKWAEPAAPDADSARWYQAATTIHAKKWRLSNAEYQKMLMLYEGAAKKGHYKAIKNLIIIYNERQYTMTDFFYPEPEKARYWLDYGLQQNWAGAFEWLSNALHYGNAGYPQDEALSLAYLQKAADLGVPFAQYELSSIYARKFERLDARVALLQCAVNQDFAPALEQMATYEEIDKHPKEALHLHQRAIIGGGIKGGEAAWVLAGAFAGKKQYQEDLQTELDPIRAKAYAEIEKAIAGTDSESGNIFLRFPRLNEVLPLPPQPMPKWQGIYSAMSEEDALYYQNLPNPDTLIAEIKAAGLLISLDYLSKPAPPEPDEFESNDDEDY